MDENLFASYGAAFQDRIRETLQSLADLRVQGQSAGGLITVEIDGNNRCTRIGIDPSLLREHDREILEDLIKVAFNQAQEALRQKISEDSSRMFGSIDAIQQLLSKIRVT